MCFNQTGDISTLQGCTLKLVDKFTYLGSSVASTETDINTRLAKAWTAIFRLSVVWKSDLTDKMRHSFFQAAVVSILLYGCTTWTLTKRMEKKLDGNYTRMLPAILNKSWRQHSTKQQLYGHLPPVNKTIKIRRTTHAGHSWWSRDKLVSDVLLWTLSQGQAKAGRPIRTYVRQLCADTGCTPEDLQKQWTTGRGGEGSSEISMLIARHDDNDYDADDIYIYIYIYIYILHLCFTTLETVIKQIMKKILYAHEKNNFAFDIHLREKNIVSNEQDGRTRWWILCIIDPFGWGSRILWLHLYRGVRLT